MKKSLINLNSKEDAKELCQGLIRDKRVSYEMMTNKNIFDAAEVLLEIGDTQSLTSQADVLTRALNHGWTPVDHEEEVEVVEKELLEKVEGEQESISERIKVIAIAIPMLALMVFCVQSTLFLTARSLVSSPEDKKQEISLVMEILLHLGAITFLGGIPLIIAFDDNK